MNIITDNYNTIFITIIVASAILAAIRGAINEVLGLLVWLISIFWLLPKIGQPISALLPASISNSLLRSLITFVIIFVLVAIVITLFKKFLQRGFTALGLGGLNHSLGAIFGAIRGLFFCAILVIVMQLFGLDNNNIWQQSILRPALAPVVNFIVTSIPNKLTQLYTPTSYPFATTHVSTAPTN